MTSARAPRRRVLPHSPFNTGPKVEEPIEQYEVDDRVSHDRYGLGTVVKLYGEAEVVVDFGSAVRRIALPNPKLVKL